MTYRITFNSKKAKAQFDRFTHEQHPHVYSRIIPIGVDFYSIMGDVIVKINEPRGKKLADEIIDEARNKLGISLNVEVM